MKVTYLDHSGFMVADDGIILVFDYYRDPSRSVIHELRRQPEADVVFLVSHHHPDHFNNEIFDLAQDHRRTYVLSDDIYSKLVPEKGLQVAWLRGGDPAIDLPKGYSVKAYGSTDAGVAYAVTDAKGRCIFHAGDLNDWHWQDESTKEEVAKAQSAFAHILNRIVEDHPQVDVAMFPVDTRMGTDFARGAREFTTAVKVANFFPMHFWNKPQEACRFVDYIATPDYTRCHCLDHPGDHAEVF